MVVDSNRVPSASPSRSRFARSTASSRIRTPRRTPRPATEVNRPESKMLSPRRESAIPTPRRGPRVPNEQKESNIPSLRRVPRTPTVTPKYAADKQEVKQSPKSGIRTPTARRTSVRAPVIRKTDSASSPSPRFAAAASLSTPRSSYRRLSTVNEESASISRPSVPKPTIRRQSSSNGKENARRPKPVSKQDDRALFPDRGTNAIGCPSPAAQNRRNAGSGTPRLGLKASPYSRRTSRGSGTGTRTSAITGTVSRKLNMGLGADADEEDTKIKRKTFSPSPGPKKNTGPSRLDIALRTGAVDRQSNLGRPDRTEKRRDSGSGKGRVGVSALESFRAARRASLEAAEQAAAETENIPNANIMPLETLSSKPPQKPAPAKREINLLPDRSDPIAPSVKMTPRKNQANPLRRTSLRFSDAEVNLDNVNRLRHSLGRRRSQGVNESGEAPDTPVLRRTSMGNPYITENVADEKSNDGFDSPPPLPADDENIIDFGYRQRSPLLAIQTNTGTDGTAMHTPSPTLKNDTESSAPLSDVRLPRFDDDEITWDHEDVEDLGAW